MSDKKQKTPTRVRLAREKWWSALSRRGDPLHLTNLFEAFHAGYSAGQADEREENASSIEEMSMKYTEVVRWALEKGAQVIRERLVEDELPETDAHHAIDDGYCSCGALCETGTGLQRHLRIVAGKGN